ncbi:MAG: hypothetical protein K6E31_02415 [bacterium]|nr:hypothetical protein [bacterium]
MLSQGLDTESGRELLRLRGRNILLTEERDALRREKDALWQEREALRQERDALRQERDVLRQKWDTLWQERNALSQERDALLSSTSWRVTEPFRRARRVVKKLFRRGIVEQSGEKDTEPLSKNQVQIAEPDVVEPPKEKGPDVSVSEGTGEDVCPASRTSEGMNGTSSSDDTSDEASPAKTAEPHFRPSGLALEALCWKAGCSPVNLLEGKGPRVSVWVAKRGNYFFHDIARLIHSGFQDMGVQSRLIIAASEEDCLDPVNLDIPLRIVVAPHEFFLFIPEAVAWPLKGERLWLVNPEQARLGWFAEGAKAKYFGRADLILDFDQDNVRQLLEAGYPAHYLPLGFSASCADFGGTAAIPLLKDTEGLPRGTREWQADVDPLAEPLSDRPLDCCFFGVSTPRRNAFFAQNAPLFAELNSYLHLQDMWRLRPLVSGENTSLNTISASSIVRRSKIALNLHQSDNLYFEWHRLVLLGMWQGAVVVSEQCSASWPLLPGRDYISASLADMPAVIEFLLKSPKGIAQAERIRRNALETLHKHSMGNILARIVREHAMSRKEVAHA